MTEKSILHMEMSKTFSHIKAYANRHNLPIIPIAAKDVSLLKDPTSFYESLLTQIRYAKERVALSALYIGTGPKEVALLQNLSDNLDENPNLKVNIALDTNRAKRLDPLGRSSLSVLEGVLRHDSVKLSLVQTNRASGFLQRFLSRYQRWNELASIYHSKLLVFDTDVIITGANLSSIYFERRQDRYIKISNSRSLSNYINGFLENLNKRKDETLKNIVDDYNERYHAEVASSTHKMDCCIIPMFQCKPHDIQSCDDFLEFLNDLLPAGVKIHLSSGYFNPTLNMKFSMVLAPSEEANGFYNASGLLKYVPRLYTALMQSYSDKNPDSQLFIYKRPGWSYHAKGLWVEGLDDINISMVGSSNFNSRSSDRDFELQFLIVTTNTELVKRMEAERADLLKYSPRVDMNREWDLNFVHKLVARLLKSLL